MGINNDEKKNISILPTGSNKAVKELFDELKSDWCLFTKEKIDDFLTKNKNFTTPDGKNSSSNGNKPHQKGKAPSPKNSREDDGKGKKQILGNC
mmetsp:Transcript_33971/g.38663  ORF Transcript_33971/g.38663 Transcript_33971/m.38663 type:complete len:94 (+) Transcript_33971:135-416(+)